MIHINHEWNAVSLDDDTVAFTTSLKSVNDAYVFDFTSEIENSNKKVSYQGEMLDVVDYGVEHSIDNGLSIFYVVAEVVNREVS